MTQTVKDIVNGALRTLGVLADAEEATGNQMADGVTALRDLVAAWSLEQILIPWRTVESFDLSDDQILYTYGTGGDFDAERPLAIYDAAVILDGGQIAPLRPIGSREWQSRPFATIVTRPSAYWYEPTLPLGTLRLDVYPVDPRITFTVSRALSLPDAITDATGTAPGYDRALRFNLAVELAPEYGVPVSGDLRLLASQSKRTLENYNTRPDTMQIDAGLLRRRSRWSIEGGPY